MAYDLGAMILHVKSNSLLVVNQMNGEFQTKDSKMTTYSSWTIWEILDWTDPRDQNTEADALANLGSAFNEPTIDCIPMIHLTGPSIENKEVVQIDDQVYNWSLGIWNYLKHDRLPEYEMEAKKTRFKASKYTIIRDQLYRRSSTGMNLICVIDKGQGQTILQEMQHRECGNHSGWRSLANRVSRQGYYWPTLR